MGMPDFPASLTAVCLGHHKLACAILTAVGRRMPVVWQIAPLVQEFRYLEVTHFEHPRIAGPYPLSDDPTCEFRSHVPQKSTSYMMQQAWGGHDNDSPERWGSHNAAALLDDDQGSLQYKERLEIMLLADMMEPEVCAVVLYCLTLSYLRIAASCCHCGCLTGSLTTRSPVATGSSIVLVICAHLQYQHLCRQTLQLWACCRTLL